MYVGPKSNLQEHAWFESHWPFSFFFSFNIYVKWTLRLNPFTILGMLISFIFIIYTFNANNEDPEIVPDLI